MPLSNDCGKACQTVEAEENDKNILWQMIYPKAETTCNNFGELDFINNSNDNKPWSSDAAQQRQGNDAWFL